MYLWPAHEWASTYWPTQNFTLLKFSTCFSSRENFALITYCDDDCDVWWRRLLASFGEICFRFALFLFSATSTNRANTSRRPRPVACNYRLITNARMRWERTPNNTQRMRDACVAPATERTFHCQYIFAIARSPRYKYALHIVFHLTSVTTLAGAVMF